MVVGGLLFASGLVHAVVWLVSGDPIGGPISFRKPASFGVSFGLTLATVGLILDRSNLAHSLKWALLGPYTLASVYEVAWVSVQRWRGVAAHFAEGGADETAWVWAGIAISVVGVSVLGATVASFLCLHEPEALAWAIRAGLVILVVAQAMGGLIIEAAEQVEAGLARQQSTTGIWKLPHAAAMHAIQVLPALALLGLRRVPFRALRAVRVATVGYGLLVVGAALGSGLLPVELSMRAATGLFVVGGVLLVVALVSVVRPGSGPYTPLD